MLAITKESSLLERFVLVKRKRLLLLACLFVFYARERETKSLPFLREAVLARFFSSLLWEASFASRGT
jgi:hypothetical protein